MSVVANSSFLGLGASVKPALLYMHLFNVELMVFMLSCIAIEMVFLQSDVYVFNTQNIFEQF